MRDDGVAIATRHNLRTVRLAVLSLGLSLLVAVLALGALRANPFIPPVLVSLGLLVGGLAHRLRVMLSRPGALEAWRLGRIRMVARSAVAIAIGLVLAGGGLLAGFWRGAP